MTEYPCRELEVKLTNFSVELDDYGVGGVFNSERQVDDSAKEDCEAEFVVVPAGVRECGVRRVCVGGKRCVA